MTHENKVRTGRSDSASAVPARRCGLLKRGTGFARFRFRSSGGSSTREITPKIADVFHAVGDVGPVLPHAVECEITNRAGLALEVVGARRYTNLNNCPFDDPHILEGLEDAIFILCADGHGLASGTLGQVDS